MTTVRVDSPTEGRNPATTGIDRLPTAEVLRLVLAEDATVPAAVAAARDELTRAVDLVVAALRAGGRVHVAGAGTSGRLAALDADELGPTYGLEQGRWTAHVAAFDGTVDGEDDTVAGTAVGALAGPGDVLIGVTASGRTPYAVAALRTAAARGAGTVLVSGNPAAAAGSEVDVHVAVRTGPEAVTGSTRMKAGTAQKLVLNALSTAAMVRSGRTWSNLMVGAVATNGKLRGPGGRGGGRGHRRGRGDLRRRGPGSRWRRADRPAVAARQRTRGNGPKRARRNKRSPRGCAPQPHSARR